MGYHLATVLESATCMMETAKRRQLTLTKKMDRTASKHSSHSSASGIGLIALRDRLWKGAEVLRLFFPPTLGRCGVGRTTTGGCLVASHEISGAPGDVSFGTRRSPHKSNSSRPKRSSSEMRKLGQLPLVPVRWLKQEGWAERKSPAGHEG